jgi:hypothetical protein
MADPFAPLPAHSPPVDWAAKQALHQNDPNRKIAASDMTATVADLVERADANGQAAYEQAVAYVDAIVLADPTISGGGPDTNFGDDDPISGGTP